MAEYTLTGLRELALNLKDFPDKLQRKALASALRAAGRVVRDDARNRVASKSGRLRRSIRVTIVRSKSGWLTARVVAGRQVKKDDPYWAWMVEGGTKPHEIRPKGKKSLFLAGLNREIVRHPGAKPHPFLGPALEAVAQAALEAMRAELEQQIEALQ